MNDTGILIVDKPADWTSHDVVAKLRGALKIKRIGHGGTLDPMATGVLPVFIGRATRAAEFCENAEKEYIAGLRLGIVTDTQDITGNTLSDCGAFAADAITPDAISANAITSDADMQNIASDTLSDRGAFAVDAITPDAVSAIIPRFLGAQQQIPPMYSAIKINVKKLYELARRGVDVPRPARNIYISGIELLGNDGTDYSLRIGCSKGTYIRTLCHDIGAALGCGGVMSSLRRTRAGAFTIDMAHTLAEILTAISTGDIGSFILSVDSIFQDYPPIALNKEEADKCKNGAQFLTKSVPNGKYRFYGPDSEFLILAEVISGKTKIIKSFYTCTDGISNHTD